MTKRNAKQNVAETLEAHRETLEGFKAAEAQEAAKQQEASDAANLEEATPPSEVTEDSDEPVFEGVRRIWTRQYVAGLAIKKFGLKLGITDDMVDWVDQTYGVEKVNQSWSCLNAAWHSIRAYTGVYASEAPKAEAEEQKPLSRAEEGKRFLDTFGQQGAVWFAMGLTFEEAEAKAKEAANA